AIPDQPSLSVCKQGIRALELRNCPGWSTGTSVRPSAPPSITLSQKPAGLSVTLLPPIQAPLFIGTVVQAQPSTRQQQKLRFSPIMAAKPSDAQVEHSDPVRDEK